MRLLTKLVSQLGKDNVLTDPEHLYVYSHFGEFGIKPLKQPLAIIRMGDSLNESHLTELIENSGVRVVRNDQPEKIEENQGPYLLLDVQKPVTIDMLLNRLHMLDEKRGDQKQTLKEVSSFSHWIVSSLQGGDGFRLWENDEDIGFCVVQSFFDDVQTYSSKGRLLLAKGYLNGELGASELLSDSIYSCTTCGQCYDQVSLDSLEVNNLIIKTRNKLTQDNNAPRSFNTALENIKTHGNPAGLPQEDRVLWIEEQVEKHPYRGNPVLFWPGCTTSYRLPELVEDTAMILEEAGYDFGLLGENEGCCGLILYLSGHWEEAKSNGAKILESLDGVERLVTNCSGCYYCFSRIYPILGLDVPFDVVHTSQMIKESILDERLQLKEYKGSYTWHDPCDLGRHSHVYEAPRYVLKSIPGLNLVEPILNREHAVCCGAGGGLWMYREELTNHVSQIKLTETLPENIDGIISGCPTCLLSLRNTAKEKKPALRVLDIVEIVKTCIQ